jgi:predicted transcriptional regulator
MNKQELKELKTKLPSGALTAIAKRSGLEISLISRVLNGHNPMFDKKAQVINAVAEYLEEIQESETKANNRAKAVLNSNLQTA